VFTSVYCLAAMVPDVR